MSTAESATAETGAAAATDPRDPVPGLDAPSQDQGSPDEGGAASEPASRRFAEDSATDDLVDRTVQNEWRPDAPAPEVPKFVNLPYIINDPEQHARLAEWFLRTDPNSPEASFWLAKYLGVSLPVVDNFRQECEQRFWAERFSSDPQRALGQWVTPLAANAPGDNRPLDNAGDAAAENNPPRPANSTAPDDPGTQTHVMKAGDTLWGISQQTGIPLEKIQAANPQITDPTKIPVGAEINIPPYQDVSDAPIAEPAKMPLAKGGDTPVRAQQLYEQLERTTPEQLLGIEEAPFQRANLHNEWGKEQVAEHEYLQQALGNDSSVKREQEVLGHIQDMRRQWAQAHRPTDSETADDLMNHLRSVMSNPSVAINIDANSGSEKAWEAKLTSVRGQAINALKDNPAITPTQLTFQALDDLIKATGPGYRLENPSLHEALEQERQQIYVDTVHPNEKKAIAVEKEADGNKYSLVAVPLWRLCKGDENCNASVKFFPSDYGLSVVKDENGREVYIHPDWSPENKAYVYKTNELAAGTVSDWSGKVADKFGLSPLGLAARVIEGITKKAELHYSDDPAKVLAKTAADKALGGAFDHTLGEIPGIGKPAGDWSSGQAADLVERMMDERPGSPKNVRRLNADEMKARQQKLVESLNDPRLYPEVFGRKYLRNYLRGTAD